MQINDEKIKQIREAILDMMSKVIYTEDGHTYKVKETGEGLQGVSTVSSIVPKDGLSAWGAKEAVKALGYSDYEGDTELAKEVMEKIKQMKTPEEYILFLKDAKGASKRKSKEALVDGTAGHAGLESYVKAKIRNTELPEIPKGNLERPIKQGLEGEKGVKQGIFSEARIANIEKGYAGTADAGAIMMDDSLALIDYKFASHFSSDYKLQVRGYEACLEKYGIFFDKAIIIRLPKTLEREEGDNKEMKYRMIPNDLEIMELKKDTYEGDRDAFFHALPLKQWINKELKN